MNLIFLFLYCEIYYASESIDQYSSMIALWNIYIMELSDQ